MSVLKSFSRRSLMTAEGPPKPDGRRRRAAAVELPRYRQVADELIKRIGAGRYSVGEYLPTEMELCREYGISRHTVREALRRVRDAGLISRRRRVGTEVVARTPVASYRQPTNSIRDLLQYADETRLSVLQTKRITCEAPLAELLECREGEAWLRVDSVRTVPDDGLPICKTTAYLVADLHGIEERLRTLTGPISAMLERVYGIRISRIDQAIQAVRLSKREAKLLKTRPGSPALRAIRRYYDSRNKLIELSSAIHPGERFTYVTSLMRE